MPITKYLENNAREYGNEVCLVELNPSIRNPNLIYPGQKVRLT